MIVFTKSFKASDDQVFGSIQEAQLHELEIVLASKNHTAAETVSFSKLILDKKDIIVDILTTGPNSKPKARAIHGGTKKRTPVAKGSVSTPVLTPTPVPTPAPLDPNGTPTAPTPAYLVSPVNPTV
jgi:hypothetical protein